MNLRQVASSAAVAGRRGGQTPSLDDRGVFLLSQLGFHVALRCAELLAPLGLQPAHYGVLMHLSSQEGLSQQQLADTMGMHRNVMVGLIDDLETDGLVRRTRHPRDRRAHRLQLTEQAHSVLTDANAAIDSLEEEIFAALDPTERDRFTRLLRHAARQAHLPVSIHPGLRRLRRAKTR